MGKGLGDGAAPLTDPHLPSLSLHLAVTPDPLPIGDTATLTITVVNSAPDPAEDLVVTLPTPDGALALPGPNTLNPATGWRWAVGRLEGLSSTTLTGEVRLVSRPQGDALLLHAEATARGLANPIAGIGGALATDRAHGPATVPFTPGAPATLRSSNGRVRVDVPANAHARPLTLRHATTPLPSAPIPPPIVGFKGGLDPIFLDASDTQGREVHQFDTRLTITVDYTPEQLAARGIDEADLTLFWFDSTTPITRTDGTIAFGQWVPIAAMVDVEARTVTAEVDHFSGFTLGDGSSPSEAYLPSLQGWQVSSFTGAASYSYPIDVPAGPNGIKPNVALTYSSAATDGLGGLRPKQQAGLIGKGWNLDLGSIATRTIVRSSDTGQSVTTYMLTLNGQGYDLERGPHVLAELPENTDSDPNNNIITPDPNNPRHWSWHTTDQSFLKVRAVAGGTSTDHAGTIAENAVYDPATSAHGRGGIVNGVWQPRYRWQIWTKDGTRYEFAEDLWSGWDKCQSLTEMHFAPYSWLLSGVTDTHGNTIMPTASAAARACSYASRWTPATPTRSLRWKPTTPPTGVSVSWSTVATSRCNIRWTARPFR